MKTILSALLAVLLIAAAVGVYLSAFIVHQTEQAMVLRFGEIKKIIQKPGLHWKVPVAEQVRYFDKRILDLDIAPKELPARDQKRLVVDAFARFKIVDPLDFYKSLTDERSARRRLGEVFEGALRRAIGASTFTDVVRDKRDALMKQILNEMNAKAKSQNFGIEVVDVRTKRVDLPEQNSEAIYKRMQTERQREAAEFRAEGNAAANRIRATADKEAVVIKANARREGQQIRGEGDAQRNAIFNKAFGRDPEFFDFYRSMQAYEKGLQSSGTRILMSPNSDFFKYFKDPAGAAKQ
jgi:modulator of FtsH protease HflC